MEFYKEKSFYDYGYMLLTVMNHVFKIEGIDTLPLLRFGRALPPNGGPNASESAKFGVGRGF